MKKLLITLTIISLLFTSCAKSIQPQMTAQQIEQKKQRKAEHRLIWNVILGFNIACIVLLYNQEERFDK